MKAEWNRGGLVLGLFLCVIVTALSGCKDSGSILKNETEEAISGNWTAAEDVEKAQSEESKSADAEEAQSGESKSADAEEARSGDETAGDGSTEESGSADARKSRENAGAADSQDSGSETLEMIFVDVCGAVKEPGVYQLSRGSRIYEAIEMAGGFLEEAESSLINQAGILEDGQQIRIYTKQEAEQFEFPAVTEYGTSRPSGQDADTSGNQTQEQKININQADKSALMTLNGIGETRAEAIIAYRETTGGFSSIEELMQVDGIKEKIYEKLKDKITVQ